MIINDPIYGKLSLTEPLIVDLINSKPMQRLKQINQHGSKPYMYPDKRITRFAHSIGAWYLSARFNRPLAEQVASLLHDIPHTAFSHVIDIVTDDKNHEYHDRFLEQVIHNSEIPEILKKYKLSLEKVLNKQAYPLLNNTLPDISVDRWDYFMRDGFIYGLLPKEIISLFLSSIKEKQQTFYFTDAKIASLFAIMFMNCSRLLWLDPDSHGSHFLLAEAIKRALKKKYITEQDFFATDAVLMNKLRETNDHQVISLLEKLKPGLKFHYAPKSEADFYGRNKPRFVDPWVLHDGKLVTLSTLQPDFKDYFKDFQKRYHYLGVKMVE